MSRIPSVDGLRREIGARWPEWAALSLYSALVAFAIPYHEPSADVAQAWQLARSLSLPALFHTYIRYEGSPGLWHFLLWVMIRAHISYEGLPWICGAIAVGATSLLVFKSPFPRYLRLALPFTVFLLFQYAVVARSYVLIPLLLYMVALWWKKSPTVLALLLGLMANVALHAAVMSGGLAVVYLVEQVRNGRLKEHRQQRQLLFFSPTLLFFYAFALWTAWPPHDLTDYVSFRLHTSASLFFLRALASLVWAVFDPWILSIPFWIVMVLCFCARRSLLYLLPVLFLAIFCGAVASDWWHFGLMIPLLICLLWITWPTLEGTVSKREAAGRIAFITLASVQILWSAYALEFDRYNAYSPDLATSKFLRPFVLQGATIAITDLDDPVVHAAGFFSVGILPYFDHNIYLNEPDLFWSWRDRNPTEEMFLKELPSHPALIVVGVYGVRPDDPILRAHPRIRLLNDAGYSITHVFCGAMPEGFRVANNNCDIVFQRMDNAEERPRNGAVAGSRAD